MLTDAVWFWKIVAAIGRLLTDYNNLEISLLHCVQKGIGDFDCAFKKMFGERGETNRIELGGETCSRGLQSTWTGRRFRTSNRCHPSRLKDQKSVCPLDLVGR